MKQAALMLSWVIAVSWQIDPLSEKLAQNNPQARKTTRAAPRRAPIKALVAQPNDDLLVQQFKQQFGPQFQQLYKTELHFMRLACQPTKQQYEKIAADGEPALKAIINKYAATWRRPRMANEQFDPRTQIADAFVQSVRSTLSAEQATRYQKELDQRTAARKRAIMLNLVAKVDNLLVLTPEQRVKLGEILEKNWDKSWDQSQWLTIGNRYFPPMPDSKILPLLTKRQKDIWRGTPKGNIYFGFNLESLRGVEIEDEIWDDKRPQQKRERRTGNGVGKGSQTSKPVEKK